ncbi:NAD(P)-dependent glycerol-3-phosphate dehydrogenase [Candidatus Sumerlaeota bacterium]|nr:NAD(P)-dependent glycerol-3-phosphate dehydrogenase [Candidatus Sumerlaeota bacterium]
MDNLPAEKRFLVLGAGTWGCTLACLLAEKGFSVSLWDVDPDVRTRLRSARIPAKLPDLKLRDAISIEDNISLALGKADFLIVTTPSHALRDLFLEIKKLDLDFGSLVIVLCSKGIERKTLLTPSGIVRDVLGDRAIQRYCCLSGPSHAEEVSQKIPTSVVAASFDPDLSSKVQDIFHTEYFRIYTQEDVLGVELGGAVKNVIAIAAGVSDGLGFGDNTKAALLTRGLAEIIRLGVAMGARRETFAGLAGIGDLIVTCISRHSRNRNFGELIAKGYSVEKAKKHIAMVVEGIITADSVMTLSEKHEIPMPISREIYSVLYEGKNPLKAVGDLMGRSLKSEIL